ncbi:probable tRNA (guanine(26)-N(2))-dimethyltransferase isoform X2 [Cimex lectularius]|uniref:tRNA (guanine(26)-N(2))-dimethyltransferase n=1 Tax=Cimex lectularius TaxID=79782 RepID=A0A8I6SNN1_CIMLE|nr:probable tRNA (guanine(26)-N(2))-dimethyltransferase isoform X2 [Cimex lectularius]
MSAKEYQQQQPRIAVLSVFSKEHKVRRGEKRNAKGEVKNGSESLRNKETSTSQDDAGSGISIFEPLSASGLRSIRFALEVEPRPREIVANDISQAAVESIRLNIIHNNVEHIVSTSHSDASAAMHTFNAKGKRFDCIDLDPYGCPSKFLDSTVQVVEDGGLIMVTCTDMALLTGNTPETCFVKYGSIPLKSPACHETALRIALQCLQSHANKYGRYIVPLLSISVDFYIRIFVKIYTSALKSKETTSHLSYVFRCVGCKTFRFQPLGVVTERKGTVPLFTLPRFEPINDCPHCQHGYQMGGPIWTGVLHDQAFVSKVIQLVDNKPERFNTSKRILGMLSTIYHELIDIPLYYVIDALCAVVHCVVMPSMTFRSALLNAGYSVSESHAAPNSIKTDAPTSFIWKVIRHWVKLNPISEKRLNCILTKTLLMAKDSDDLTPDVNFDIHPHAPSRSHGLLRYQMNPTKFWGPGVRSTINTTQCAKQKDNQNKKKNKQTKNKIKKCKINVIK